MRAEVLRRVTPYDSYHFADRIFVAEIGLQGPSTRCRSWLYFRRHHPTRPGATRHACPVRGPGPAPGGRLRNPPVPVRRIRLGLRAAIRWAPLSPADRRECYRSWRAGRPAGSPGRGRAFPAAASGSRSPPPRHPPASPSTPSSPAGREGGHDRAPLFAPVNLQYLMDPCRASGCSGCSAPATSATTARSSPCSGTSAPNIRTPSWMRCAGAGGGDGPLRDRRGPHLVPRGKQASACGRRRSRFWANASTRAGPPPGCAGTTW